MPYSLDLRKMFVNRRSSVDIYRNRIFKLTIQPCSQGAGGLSLPPIKFIPRTKIMFPKIFFGKTCDVSNLASPSPIRPKKDKPFSQTVYR